MLRGEICAFRLGDGGRKRLSAGSGLTLGFDRRNFHSFWKAMSSNPGMVSCQGWRCPRLCPFAFRRPVL
jgi:hypothetical protein